ncbi:hypothetical protein EZS27_011519 [termite gut metagenome]|uniref:Uncharacterized protein n=1 Tax=termite gut metagenome TaxID=433724 RepID=A0A5J4S5L7_9ZZZZ
MILIILNITGLLGTLIWLLISPGWEPFVAVIGMITTLIVQLFGGGNNNLTKMSQKGGKNSINYQSNENITINN